MYITTDATDKTAIELMWHRDPDKLMQKKEDLGKYILRTDLDFRDEVLVWKSITRYGK